MVECRTGGNNDGQNFGLVEMTGSGISPSRQVQSASSIILSYDITAGTTPLNMTPKRMSLTGEGFALSMNDSGIGPCIPTELIIIQTARPNQTVPDHEPRSTLRHGQTSDSRL